MEEDEEKKFFKDFDVENIINVFDKGNFSFIFDEYVDDEDL